MDMNSGLDANNINPQMRNPKLSEVQKGMKVFDINHREIGTVEDLFIGETGQNDLEEATGPASTHDDLRPGGQFVDTTPNFAFGGGVNPTAAGDEDRTIEDRLNWEGYIRISMAGLFSSDRYALPDQIEAVRDNEVLLNVTKENLLKK